MLVSVRCVVRWIFVELFIVRMLVFILFFFLVRSCFVFCFWLEDWCVWLLLGNCWWWVWWVLILFCWWWLICVLWLWVVLGWDCSFVYCWCLVLVFCCVWFFFWWMFVECFVYWRWFWWWGVCWVIGWWFWFLCYFFNIEWGGGFVVDDFLRWRECLLDFWLMLIEGCDVSGVEMFVVGIEDFGESCIKWLCWFVRVVGVEGVEDVCYGNDMGFDRNVCVF